MTTVIDKPEPEPKHKNIIVSDKSILAFYAENKHLDFVAMNLLFIDIIKQITANNNETISSSINQQILNTLQEMDTKLDKNNLEIKNVSLFICNHLNEQKKQHLEDLKLILSNSNVSVCDKVIAVCDKNTEFIFAKMTSFFQENLPKLYETNATQIGNILLPLNNDCKKILSVLEDTGDDKNNTSLIMEAIDCQLNKTINNLQQFLFLHLQTNQEKTAETIGKMTINNQSLVDDLNMFLNRYKHNSSVKGIISETELYQILQKIFPEDEIIDNTNSPQSCDFVVNRLDGNKPSILFENKNYEKKVNTEEVQKFERDVMKCNKHGIMISQNSLITFKKQYQIDIVNGLIMVYIGNVNYDEDKIKTAVDIVDALHKYIILQQNGENGGSGMVANKSIIITDEDFMNLKKMYDEFQLQKTKTIETIKNVNKLLLESVGELQMNFLKNLIVRETVVMNDFDVLKCPHCDFIGKNKGGLSAHIKKHKREF